ncbi:MAG: type II secretion system ATPase GspE [Deltaproteobacteria bacterium]|nr:type II secretion system ATPase GspE [Deltaproteobacteria bacterium]MBK9645003.1 type II secretion system ATPase GspE [Deltaproteobacteria bacterium]
MSIRRRELSELLVEAGVTAQRVKEAEGVATKNEMPLLEAFQRADGLSKSALAHSLSVISGLPVMETINLDRLDLDVVRALPLGLAREKGFLPLWEENGRVLVAIASPATLPSADDLRVMLRKPIQAVLVPADELRNAINKAFDKASRSASAVLEEVREEKEGDLEGDLNLQDDILDDPNQAPIIRFVNTLLTQAIKDRASDIHIEPFEKELNVRFRIDGVLYEIVKPPPRLQASIVSRIKIMAGLNIAEKRIPQDGRIRIRMAGREVDLRVSTLPVRHGERVVMRILEKGSVFSLDAVGMAKANLETFRSYIQRPHGIILVTGPTGSGKTTTLYSALAEINAPDLNILTIEDPIEYELRGVGQTQVNPKIDLTFASALRAHLRQDPDVILVGEIRDKETADNAVQASLTGHLVFSTLHTNDAAGAFPRLTDMGVEPFLVSSSLLMVLAQRLVRRLCPSCKEVYDPSDLELRELGLTRASLVGQTVYRAKGCAACLSTGYKGRTGIYEILVVTDSVRALVMQGKDAGTIRKAALADGMKTLRDDGVRKVFEGASSFEEIMRITQEDALE